MRLLVAFWLLMGLAPAQWMGLYPAPGTNLLAVGEFDQRPALLFIINGSSEPFCTVVHPQLQDHYWCLVGLLAMESRACAVGASLFVSDTETRTSTRIGAVQGIGWTLLEAVDLPLFGQPANFEITSWIMNYCHLGYGCQSGCGWEQAHPHFWYGLFVLY